MTKPNYYAVIPAEVRYNKNLTPNAKLLYAEITALCGMNGKCIASTQYFCKVYEVSRASIQNWLKLLEKNGYITRDVKYRQGSKEILSRSIKLVDKPIQIILILKYIIILILRIVIVKVNPKQTHKQMNGKKLKNYYETIKTRKFKRAN